MFFTATYDGGSDFVGVRYPIIQLFPSVSAHQFSKDLTDSRGAVGTFIRILEFSLNIITNSHDDDTRPELRYTKITGIKQFDLYFVSQRFD